jgi:hypothetical protein
VNREEIVNRIANHDSMVPCFRRAIMAAAEFGLTRTKEAVDQARQLDQCTNRIA